MRRLLLRHRGKGGGFDIVELDPPNRPIVLVSELTIPEVTAFLIQASQLVYERGRQTVAMVGHLWRSLP